MKLILQLTAHAFEALPDLLLKMMTITIERAKKYVNKLKTCLCTAGCQNFYEQSLC